MTKRLIIAGVACILSGPVAAQVVEEPSVGPGIASEASSPPAAGTAAPLKPTLGWKLQLAPSFGNNLLKDEGDRLSEYQSTSAGLEASVPFTAAVKLTVEGGAKIDTDFDDDSGEDGGSAFVGSGKLEWGRGFRRVSPFLTYGFEAGYTDVFDKHSYTDQRLAAGVSFKSLSYIRCNEGQTRDECLANDIEGLSFVISPQIERTFSDEENRERTTLKLGSSLAGKLVNRIKWNIDATGEARFFDRFAGVRKEVYKAVIFGGVDVAELFAPNRRLLKNVKLGVRWSGSTSDVDGDRSDFHFLPVLTIGGTFE